jgi:4-hydroxy-tetrahydrodipicolinate reductase
VLATRFATLAARFYESVEIVEAHHQGKVDSPSGTAVRTAELIAEARRDLGPVSAPHADQRARGQQVASVPVHSMRLRGVVARQEVVFGGEGETLTLTHDTLSQRAYEQGLRVAIAAAPGVTGVVVGLDAVLPLDS